MKKLEVGYRFNDGRIYLRIVEQTHRQEQFGSNYNEFETSVGIRLESCSYPELNRVWDANGPTDNYNLFCRGDDSYEDNNELLVEDPNLVFRINAAVDEYNRHFA